MGVLSVSHFSLPRKKKQDPKSAYDLLLVLTLTHYNSSSTFDHSEPAGLQYHIKSLSGGKP